jgi:UDP-glucose 4-epimerase
VSDTVSGIYASIFTDAANGKILNIGNDEEVTILELARRIKKASGTPGELKIEFVPYESFSGKKYEDVRRRVPDTSLAESILGVKATVSLDDGLKSTIDWQRKAMAESPSKSPKR